MSAPSPKSLLIVGDPALSRNLMQLVLNRLRYAVDCTLTARETLEQVARKRYALIFVALTLPDGSGLDLARRLRREVRSLRSVPILLFGDAWDEASVRRSCEEANLQGYLAKPISIGRLLGVIRELTLHPPGTAAAEARCVTTEREDPAPRESLDLGRLRELTDDDRQLMVEIGTLFVGTARQYLDEIEHAQAAGTDCSGPAHALKGASRNIGAERMGQIAERLEREGPAPDLVAAARDELDVVSARFDQLAEELQSVSG